MLYLPYGEEMARQKVAGWATPYTFTGKEKDDLTGLQYFGARYYDSRISIWYGVDPMADKYPQFTPFNSTLNNPIRLVDPDGMEAEEGFDEVVEPPFKNSHSSLENDNKKMVQFLEKFTENNNSDGSYEPNIDKPYSAGSQTRWLDIAEGELGQSEIFGNSHNPRIIEYHSTTSLKASTDETAWCSSFVNWCMNQIDLNGTNSASALSWRNWTGGDLLNKPAIGSIGIINYGEGKGHVGFVAGKNQNGSYVLIGGNQGNMVKYSAFSAQMRFMHPKGFSKDFNLPILYSNPINNFFQTR
jgi:uncharacterized protein (TIGR02594 family)